MVYPRFRREIHSHSQAPRDFGHMVTRGFYGAWVSMGSLRSITPYNGREDLEQVKQERGTQLCTNRKVLPIAKINL